LVDQSIRITDLDEGLNIGLHHPSYQLPMVISHRAIMDIGIVPYLSTIASSIITSLEDENLFGKYKARVAIVTGSLLYQWLYEFQPAYSNFIWHQLITALASQTYLKQTTTSIILTKDYVRKHHCFEYVPYEREKYQQVLSKSFFLEVEHVAGPQAEVYINHGTFYERVPHKKMSNGRDTWIIQLLQGQIEPVSQHTIKKSIYLRLKGGLSELSSTAYKTLYYSIGKGLIAYSIVAHQFILAYLIDLIDTVISDEALLLENTRGFAIENVSLTTSLSSSFRSSEEFYNMSSFPIDIYIKSSSFLSAINVEIQTGFDDFGDGYHCLADIPERLTVRQIPKAIV